MAPTAAYANLGEIVLAGARVAFRLVLIARLVAFAGLHSGLAPSKVLVGVGTLIATVALSMWATRRAKRRTFGPQSHVVSALADVVLCVVPLLSTVTWPEAEYSGLLHKPDVAVLSVLVLASGLRLEPIAIAVSALASLAALFVLAFADVTLNRHAVSWHAHDVEMTATLLTVAGVGAACASWFARRLLRDLARESMLVARGQDHLREVLRQHHDVRTLLSTARLHLDLLAGEAPVGPLRDHATSAVNAVGAIADTVAEIRNRTFGEVIVAGQLARVELADVVRAAVAAVHARFPAVTVRGAPEIARLTVRLFGGERALIHMLMNLLVNACEGDGRRGASFVEIRARLDHERPGFAKLEVIDDGPGLHREVLRAGPKLGLTTKSSGGGLGLGLVTEMVRASNGDVALDNRPSGGACVSLWLQTECRLGAAPSNHTTAAH